MICNICSDNSPDDAQYCINCGAILSYTGKTQRLETERLIEEMQRPSASISPSNYRRRYVHADDIEKELHTPYDEWRKKFDADKNIPWHLTQAQIDNLVSEIEFLSNGSYKLFGREVIIVDD